MSFADVLGKIDAFLWGVPLMVLLVGAGIILSIRTGFVQARHFGYILKNTMGKMFEKHHDLEEGAITPFQALSTALAATVGTGNIVGVSVAILGGGPGAVFWMWVAAFFGMCTKFSEVNLSVAYRVKTPDGYAGGPMYYLDRGLKKPWLGKCFAFLAGVACFGIGCSVQSNAIAGTLKSSFHVPPHDHRSGHYRSRCHRYRRRDPIHFQGNRKARSLYGSFLHRRRFNHHYC